MTSVTGRLSTPNAARISSVVAGSPTVTPVAMPSWLALGQAEHPGQPGRAGDALLDDVAEVGAGDVLDDGSASTQWAEVAWYSYARARLPVEPPPAKAARRPSRRGPSGRSERGVGEAGRVQHHLLDGDDVLAVGAELRHVGDHRLLHVDERRRRSAPTRRRRRRPSCRRTRCSGCRAWRRRRSRRRPARRRGPGRPGTRGGARRPPRGGHGSGGRRPSRHRAACPRT